MTGRPGRVVVLTGASAGIGRAAAIAFGRRRCRVALVARSREALEAARTEVEAAGGEAAVFIADMADAEAVAAAADEIASLWGGIDIWVNNAMASVFAPVDRMTADEFRRVTEVTYLGYVFGTQAALKHMRTRNSGTIVQVGSALSYRAIPLQSAYCAAKFAIRGFTDSLRCELLHDRSRIRVTMVQLPAVNTPQFDWARNKMGRTARPLGAIVQPEAIAEKIVRAAERTPRELWIGYSAVKAILGAMFAPGYADRVLARKAYDGQLTDEALPADAPDNLWNIPPARLHKVHGRFDSAAASSVTAVTPIALCIVAVCAAIAVIWLL